MHKWRSHCIVCIGQRADNKNLLHFVYLLKNYGAYEQLVKKLVEKNSEIKLNAFRN